MEHTTLRIQKDTLRRLQRHGSYGDSMDSIISKILDRLEVKSKQK